MPLIAAPCFCHLQRHAACVDSNFGDWLGNSALHHYLYVPVEFRLQVDQTGIFPKAGRSADLWHVACKVPDSGDELRSATI